MIDGCRVVVGGTEGGASEEGKKFEIAIKGGGLGASEVNRVSIPEAVDDDDPRTDDDEAFDIDFEDVNFEIGDDSVTDCRVDEGDREGSTFGPFGGGDPFPGHSGVSGPSGPE